MTGIGQNRVIIVAEQICAREIALDKLCKRIICGSLSLGKLPLQLSHVVLQLDDLLLIIGLFAQVTRELVLHLAALVAPPSTPLLARCLA